jgi:hypothetical protein
MKKFALVLVSVLLVLSCGNRKSRLLFEVHEVDYRNKSDITLNGTEVEAEWPLEMRAIAVCDSFLLVKSGDNEHILYVYSDDLKLKGGFGCIGRARNEFLSTSVQWSSAQILRNEQGDAMIPLVDMQQGTKLLDLQKSLEAQSTVIAAQNDFLGRHTYEYTDENYKGRRVVMSTVVRTQYLDNDINHRFSFFHPITERYEDKVYTEPVFAITLDTARVKEIRMLSRFEVKDADYVNGFMIKHPSRNIAVQALYILDYILFFDLDNDRAFAIHQPGSPSFDDDLPAIEFMDIKNADGTVTYTSTRVPCFRDLAATESFFMVTYYNGDYCHNQTDVSDIEQAAPELLFFDWDGNFLKSFKLDTHVDGITYDEKNQILYGMDAANDRILRFDLKNLRH